MTKSNKWWESGVIYHIYPRSFQDSNDDGIGDLNGISLRLDYLKWLGADAIWLSPVYPSPMADFGYDVSDHCDIDPMFGTLDDMDRLIEETHRHDLRIILDFVPNHTSIEHPWFKESRSSRNNPKRDWYYWKDSAKDGGPPNNWLSRFDGESAWEWDEKTEQYFLHTFLVEQPDLNWRNPVVRKAMLNILHFWFDRGVDGFRVDVSYRVMKDPEFRDNPPNPDWKPGMDRSFRVIEKHTKNTPDIHKFNRWIRQTCDEYDNRVTIGEMNLKIPELVEHYGTEEKPEFHLPFNFRLIFSEWESENVKWLVDQFEEHVPDHGWPNWVLNNHDQPRFATRAGKDQARNGLLFLLTARGTPTIYYGDELAMQSVEIPPDHVQDPWELLSPGLGLGRDPVRTPMQWNSSKHAGFCSEDLEPWLPVGEGSKTENVEVQKKEKHSTLNFVRKVIQFRRDHRALATGSCKTLELASPVLAYIRRSETTGETFLIALNFSSQSQSVDIRLALSKSLPDNEDTISFSSCLISTKMDEKTDYDNNSEVLRLRSNEGVIFRYSKKLD